MKALLTFKLLLATSLLILKCTSIFAEEPVETDSSLAPLVLAVEHSLDGGRTFSLRGSLAVQSVRSGSATFRQEPLSDAEQKKLQTLCSEGNGLYLLRAAPESSSSSPSDTSEESYYHRAVGDACSLLQGGLTDVITLHLDWRSQLVGISTAALSPTWESQAHASKGQNVIDKREPALRANAFK